MISEADLAQYATWGGYFIMILILFYHYEITAPPEPAPPKSAP